MSGFHSYAAASFELPSLCPNCGDLPKRVWREGGEFQQRTECPCGRKTQWVVYGPEARAETEDDEVCAGIKKRKPKGKPSHRRPWIGGYGQQ